MRTIKPQDIPEILTTEVVDILAEMSMAFPVTGEWRQVAEVLTDEQRIMVDNRVSEINRKIATDRKAGMSEREKAKEAEQWEIIKNDNNPHRFYGNMGQPETPQEFKNRYGVWPLGYDENGNKLP
jgi:hypothetical protein